MKFPTSPDGTDWNIYGESAKEQWNGVVYEAYREDNLRSHQEQTMTQRVYKLVLLDENDNEVEEFSVARADQLRPNDDSEIFFVPSGNNWHNLSARIARAIESDQERLEEIKSP